MQHPRRFKTWRWESQLADYYGEAQTVNADFKNLRDRFNQQSPKSEDLFSSVEEFVRKLQRTHRENQSPAALQRFYCGEQAASARALQAMPWFGVLSHWAASVRGGGLCGGEFAPSDRIMCSHRVFDERHAYCLPCARFTVVNECAAGGRFGMAVDAEEADGVASAPGRLPCPMFPQARAKGPSLRPAHTNTLLTPACPTSPQPHRL